MTIQVRRPASLINQYLNVLNFTRDGIQLGISTVTSPSTVVVIGRKVGREKFGEFRPRPRYSGTKCPSHQDERGSLARLIESNGGAVFGNDCSHAMVLLHSFAPFD